MTDYKKILRDDARSYFRYGASEAGLTDETSEEIANHIEELEHQIKLMAEHLIIMREENEALYKTIADKERLIEQIESDNLTLRY